MVGFQKASNLLSKKLSQNIIKQSLAALNTNVFTSLDDPGNDNLVDLSLLFGNQKPKLMTKEYLDSFMHLALTWDHRFTSSNLILHDPTDPRVVTCKLSMETFKSTYSTEAFEPGDRYFFQVKLLHGCNFKIGVSKTRSNKEVAFCDSTLGYGYYSAGQLRNGSKTSGKKYGESFKGTLK